MTQTFNKKVHEMLADLEGNLNIMNFDLKTRVQSLRDSKPNIIAPQNQDGNNSSHAKTTNGNEIMPYTGEAPSERPGRRRVKQIVDDIHTISRNVQMEYNDLGGDRKATLKTRLRIDRVPKKMSTNLTLEGSPKPKKKPPVPPRTKKSFEAKLSVFKSPQKEPSSSLSSSSYAKPKTDIPRGQLPVAQLIQQRFSFDNVQDATKKIAQRNDTVASNLPVRIGRRPQRSPRERVQNHTERRLPSARAVRGEREHEARAKKAPVSGTLSPKADLSPVTAPKKQTNAKAAERWKKIRDLLKTGKLLTEIENKRAEKRAARNMNYRSVLKPVSFVGNGEMASEYRRAIQMPERATSSERWQKLKSYVHSGKFLVHKKVKSQNEDKQNTKSEANALVFPTSDRSKKVEKLIQTTTVTDESHEGIKRPAKVKTSERIRRSVDALAENEEAIQKAQEKWKSLRNHLKSGSKVFLENADRKPITHDTLDRKPLTEKTSDKWERFRERLETRRALQEEEISYTLGVAKKAVQRTHNIKASVTDSGLGEHNERHADCTSKEVNPNPKSTECLSRITGLVAMLVHLVEESANGEENPGLWNEIYKELALINGIVGGLSSTKYFDAKMEMERAEAALRCKLKKLISLEEYRSRGLDDDIAQLRTTAVVRYAVCCDEPVFGELRGLLSSLHALTRLLSESSSKNRLPPEDIKPTKIVKEEDRTTSVPAAMERQTPPVGGWLSILRGANLQEGGQLKDETTVRGSKHTNGQAKRVPTEVHTEQSENQNESAQEKGEKASKPNVESENVNDDDDKPEGENELAGEGKLLVEQKLLIKYVTDDKEEDKEGNNEDDQPIFRNPFTRRSLVRASFGLLFGGFFISLVYATGFGEDMLDAWLYYWALVSCNVRLTHSSSRPVV